MDMVLYLNGNHIHGAGQIARHHQPPRVLRRQGCHRHVFFGIFGPRDEGVNTRCTLA